MTTEPGFPDEPKPKWVDLWGMDPDYGDTTEAAERAAEIATASKLGFELGKAEGRKQAGEEIAEAISTYNQEWSANTWRSIAAGIAREIASEPLRAAFDGLTDVPASPRTPEDSQARRIRIPRGEG